nr:MAG: holin family protein [Bacteriophage sp.]
MDVTQEQLRLMLVSAISPILAFLTPTSGFITALVFMFVFNIICGMRADGVSVSVRGIQRFTIFKFISALQEFLLYMMIIVVLFSAVTKMGDKDAAIMCAKTITYVFMYVYLCNGFRNLCTTYPKNKGFKLIYHIIRFEFKRLMGEHAAKIIEEQEEK